MSSKSDAARNPVTLDTRQAGPAVGRLGRLGLLWRFTLAFILLFHRGIWSWEWEEEVVVHVDEGKKR